ncbi:MAG: S9 family peptidase [Planctomycetota bacterium]
MSPSPAPGLPATKNSSSLIPRTVLFGNARNASPSLSPDGRYLTWVAPSDGVLNLWMRTVGAQDDRPLTADRGRGVFNYSWAFNGAQVLYTQDRDGDENHRLFAVDIAGGETRALTPDDREAGHKIQARILAARPRRPDEVMIGLNRRDVRQHDAWRLNVRTGSLELVEEAGPLLLVWLIDNDLRVRGRIEALPDGGGAVLVRDAGGGLLRELFRLSAEDFFTSGVIGFTPDNEGLLLRDSRGRNTAALVEIRLSGGESRVMAADPAWDLYGAQRHPTAHTIEAVAFNRERLDWEVIDPAVAADFARLRDVARGNMGVISRTLDNRRWLVEFAADDGPMAWYDYDRDKAEARLLFHHRPELLDYSLASMTPVRFDSRDGLLVHGYLTLPNDWQGPGPMVLNVHGGPWTRDSWGYHAEAQWLANRGYACLQVNYRGSTSYGKAFLNAGDREWGGAMLNDLSDAVAWAVRQGVADPARVVIYGGSYGGFATLCGMTFTPELYAGGVSLVGPSSLETFLNTIPPYWTSARRQLDDRVGRIPRYDGGKRAGQPKDPADQTVEEKAEIEFLRGRSPLFHVQNVRSPMLIAQGANDPRVKRAESDQFVKAMESKGLKVEYAVYENEGHGFARPANRLDFYRRAEKFLAEILGGRCES